MTFRAYDVVRLKRPLPQHGLEAGAIGAIVMVYDDPAGYEVEFCDRQGVTLALLTLQEVDMEATTG